MGEDAFRAGVRRYMARHAYGNTVTDDLWRAMDEGSAQPITAIAHDLTLQPGVPLVAELGAECHDGRTTVTLAQQQFAVDPDPAQPRRWQVPVILSTLGGGTAREVIDGPRPQRVTLDGCGPVILNAGQTGYFRVRYDEAGLVALTTNFARLSPDDQLGLLNDTQALAFAGRVPMSTLLALQAQVPADADAIVADVLVQQLVQLDRLGDGGPAQPAFRAFARGLIAPIFARVGWRAERGRGDDESLLRARLIEALGGFGDAAVVAGVDVRFHGFLEKPDSLPAGIREAVLRVVARRADAPTWDALHALARSAPSYLEREDDYKLLAMARDPALLASAFAVATSGEPPLSMAGSMLRTAADAHPQETLSFMLVHWPDIARVLGEDAGPTVVARFFNEGDDLSMVEQLDTFAAQHVPPTADRGLVKTQALVRYRATVRNERLPEAARWLAREPQTVEAGGADTTVR